ncbi:MAG TPA: ABC transporter permease [Bryobacteraceae bacterium]|jgi:predicted permease|nr:ABC transporter permease [Bryobacteraceae bacterium]
MNWLHRLFKKRQLETELAKELQDHLERQVSDYRQSGLTEEEARRKAFLTFGGIEQIREECREARGTRWIESTVQDLRLALRTLCKGPGFTLTALATLALGIGANTAIFALLDAVRLRSLPVPEPQKLALLQIEGGNGFGVSRLPNSLSYAVFEQIRDHQRGFSSVFAWAANTFELGEGASERAIDGLWVSGGIFSTLGIAPVKGRFFSTQEDGPGCGIPGAVISYGFWQAEFGGLDSAIGAKLVIQGHPTEIIGVSPPSFAGLEVGKTFAVALPLCSLSSYSPDDDSLRRTDYSFLTVMGRLRAGWALAQAKDQLASISPAIFQATLPAGYAASSHNDYLKSRLVAYLAGNGVSGLRDTYDESLWLLLGITGLVLLIACTNLANLMLVRATTREREMAVRLAIGASRWRLIRQLLTEGLVLAAAGAILGACLARVISRSLVLFLTTQRDLIYLDLSLNWRVLGFAAGVAFSTCLVFGLVPAFRGSKIDPGEAMKAGSRGVTGNLQRGWFQSTLVVSQIAISLVLLIAAILFVRSFWNLMTINPGFRERGIVVASLDFSRVPRLRSSNGALLEWTEDRAAVYFQNVMDGLRALPQVRSAGTSTHVPLDGSSWTLGFHISGEKGESKFTWASSGYFETEGKPVLQGRAFNDRDTSSSPRVAIVNQTFVRRFLNDLNPLGRTLRTVSEPNYPASEYQIVGVVKDAKYASLREEIPPEVFASAQQRGVSAFPNVFIRSSFPPGVVISAVRQKLNEISPEIRSNFRIFETEIRDGLVRERLMAILAGFFGALAALLAVIGLYGVISYIVLARRNEIGVRLALGATRGSIITAVLRRASVLLLSGTALGVLLALAGAVSARSLLFGLQSYDPITFIGASFFLLGIAFAASFLPARRASRLDPLAALRYE